MNRNASFDDLERFARKKGLKRPGRVVGGPLRTFYLRHPSRVQLVRAVQLETLRLRRVNMPNA